MTKVLGFILVTFCLLCNASFAIEKLRVYQDATPEKIITSTSDYLEIQSILQSAGITFEQWNVRCFMECTTDEQILSLYSDKVAQLADDGGYQFIDFVRMNPDSPNKEFLRKKFLNEHTHTEDEVRFFVEGSGLFYLHVADKVYIVLCEMGDLISIPAGYRHWFDMGDHPYFVAMRFFTDNSGWVAHFTEDPIAQNFPKYNLD